jgi:acid phosphatase (class A)
MRFVLHRLRFALAASLLFSAAAAQAQDRMIKPEAASGSKPHFVDTRVVDAARILPPPPAPGSLAAEADLAAVLQVQAWRTPEQVAWAQLVDKFDAFAIFGAEDLLGPNFTRESHPLLVALFKDLTEDLSELAYSAKRQFDRPRPFVVDSRIKPCVPAPTNFSYPSGHSFGIYVAAGVLAEVFPDKREAIMERAARAAWGRVLAGVHYPTDLEGGRILAEAGMAELMKSEAFRGALEKCRAEAAALAMKKAA